MKKISAQTILENRINLSALFILVLYIGITFSCKTPQEEPGINNKELPFSGVKLDLIDFDSVHPGFSVHYLRNQFFAGNFQSPHTQALEDSLRTLGFVKQVCPCHDRLAIWSFATGAIDSILIEVGTSTSQGPRIGGIDLFDEGLLLNNIISFNPFKETELSDTLGLEKTPFNCPPPITDVKIAIVDSGVDSIVSPNRNVLMQAYWRPFNDGNICYTNDFQKGVAYLFGRDATEPDDHNSHGTSVNGVLSGNSYPNVHMPMPFYFLNVRFTQRNSKDGNLFDALCALYYALEQNPRIINISWGFGHRIDTSNKKLMKMDRNYNKLFQDFLNHAAAKNVLVIAGFGNDSSLVDEKFKFYPACLAKDNTNLVSVGALDVQSKNLTEYSNWSDISNGYMTLTARGDSIVTTVPRYLQSERLNTGYRTRWGSSYATPMVSRMAGFLLAHHPELTARELKEKLIHYSNLETDVSKGIKYRKLDLERIKADHCGEMEKK